MDKNSTLNLENYLSSFSLNERFWDSLAEGKIYPVLKEMFDEHYIVLPHVAFTDVFKIKNDDDEISLLLYKKISNYHFDFVIYDAIVALPVLFIEINGSAHTFENKNDIDKFKKSLIETNHLILVPIDLFDSLSDKELKAKIYMTLFSYIDSKRKYPVYCPDCKHILRYGISPSQQYGQKKKREYICDNCSKIKPKIFNETEIAPLFTPTAMKTMKAILNIAAEQFSD